MDNIIDMLTADLLKQLKQTMEQTIKHKIGVTRDGKGIIFYDSESFTTVQRFITPYIENVERMDASLLKPIIMYMFSYTIHKQQDIPIEWRVDQTIRESCQLNRVEITIKAYESLDHGSNLTSYRFENLIDSPELFFTRSCVDSFSFPEHLLNKPFFVLGFVHCYYSSNKVLKPSPPPLLTTYKEDCCVICLEAKPNILYLDCMHIAICDSCDRMKSKTSSQSTCDVCRVEISKRVKI